MKAEHFVDLQGRKFVLYAGLLAEAHEQGLKEITTTLVQLPSPANDLFAVVCAQVTTEKGTFTGIGDASPASVSRMMLPHLLRMAETRAKARALRDAVNVGVTAFEELGGDDRADEAATAFEGRQQGSRIPAIRRLPQRAERSGEVREVREVKAGTPTDELRDRYDRLAAHARAQGIEAPPLALDADAESITAAGKALRAKLTTGSLYEPASGADGKAG